MNYFLTLVSILFLYTNAVGAQEIPATPLQSAGMPVQKVVPNPSKKLALLLPFNLAKMQIDSSRTLAERLKKDKFLNMTLDFYTGALVAIDSAKKLGIAVDVSVFDSEETKNSSNVAQLIREHQLDTYSAVIGPFYQTNVEKAAELLSANQVAVISPLSKDMGKSYPNLVQTVTAPTILRGAIFDFMRSKNGAILAVVDKKKGSIKKYISENQKDVRFAALDADGALNVASLKALLVKNKINYVVMETANTSMIKATISALLAVQSMYQLQLVILEPNETLDTDEIEFKNLIQLKLMYPSMTRENDSAQAMLFENAYKSVNKVTPNFFAIRGFDLTFDTLKRLSQAATFFETSSTQSTEQVNSKFEYIQNESGGYSNKGMYILYYDTDLLVKHAK